MPRARATLCFRVSISHFSEFSCFRAQALGHLCFGVVVHGLSAFSSQAASVGSVAVVRALVAPQRVGASQTRDRTHAPCSEGAESNHWTAREFFPVILFFNSLFIIFLG